MLYLQAAKKLTLQRYLNAVKVYSSYRASLILRRPIVSGYPTTFFIEPTNRCNLFCPECPSGLGQLTRALGMMKKELFEKLIDEISPYALCLQMYWQGEPYINKELPSMLEYARKKGLYSILSTNGTLINEKNVERIVTYGPDELIFSLDGLDEESYTKYRVGGSFADAERALLLLSETKRKMKVKRPRIEIQFIVMKHNEHQVDMLAEYGKKVGANGTYLKTMQVTTTENAERFLPKTERYRRYKVVGNSFFIKSQLQNECFNLWHTGTISWDGNVVPCCFDKDVKYPIGNITNHTFREIWHSDEFNNFRMQILQNRRSIPMCTNCTSGLDRNVFSPSL